MRHKYDVGDKVYFRPDFTLEDVKQFLNKRLPLLTHSASDLMLEEISDIIKQKECLVITGRTVLSLRLSQNINCYYVDLPESLLLKRPLKLRWIYFEDWLVPVGNEVHIEEEE